MKMKHVFLADIYDERQHHLEPIGIFETFDSAKSACMYYKPTGRYDYVITWFTLEKVYREGVGYEKHWHLSVEDTKIVEEINL